MPVVEPENVESPGRQPKSLEELFLALETPLLRYSFRLVRSVETSQDIVQEAFMRLHAQTNPVREPRAWLFRTAHNLAMNHHRKQGRLIPISHRNDDDAPEFDPADPEPLPDEQIERIEAVGQARLSLETLDERSRMLVRLKFEDGLSYKEMAERTGLSTGNVGYILHHALKALAVELENNGVGL